MKVLCISNTGSYLRKYEYEKVVDEHFGRFGSSAYSKYDLTIGRQYLVMGILTFKTYQAYLVDDDGMISVCPCQLFEIIDSYLNPNWGFRLIDNDESIYPFLQSILGYFELYSERDMYEKLIIEGNDQAERIYYQRKLEFQSQIQ